MIVAYIDGGARGNPGPAGYGVRVEQTDGTLIEEFSGSIGVATNNVAEYRGLLAALEWAKAHDHHELHVRSDSLLLVQQMRGIFKVKHPGLQPLHAKWLLAQEIGRVRARRLCKTRMLILPTPLWTTSAAHPEVSTLKFRLHLRLQTSDF
jgi:ribonuclease HI